MGLVGEQGMGPGTQLPHGPGFKSYHWVARFTLVVGNWGPSPTFSIGLLFWTLTPWHVWGHSSLSRGPLRVISFGMGPGGQGGMGGHLAGSRGWAWHSLPGICAFWGVLQNGRLGL